MRSPIARQLLSAACLATLATACGEGLEEAQVGTPEPTDMSQLGQEACSPPTNYPWATPKYADVQRATTIARDQICKGYVYGNAGPSTFDCSGLAYYAYRNAGFAVDRLSAQGIYNSAKSAGSKWGSLVGAWEKRAGDLLFYSSGACNANNITHVSIYMGVNSGNNKEEVVQALNPSTGVLLSGTSIGGMCLLDTVVRVRY